MVAAPVVVAAIADPVVAAAIADPVVTEPFVTESTVTEPVVASAVVEPPVAEPPVAEPPVAEPPVAAVVAEPPVAEPPSAPAQPAFTQPLVEPPPTVLEAPPVAALQADVALPAAASSTSPPPLPLAPSSSRLSPLPSSLSVPPPPATLSARLVNSIPPHWIEIARQHPALWMVAAPLVLASLLVLILMIGEPPHASEAAKPAPSVAAAPAVVEPAPAAAPAAPATTPQLDDAALAALEAKASNSLSVAELLLLNEGHANKKRDEARALSLKLQQEPDAAKDEAVQAQLLRFAGDPVTADVALGAMAQAHSPVGPDLLYEVWTSRAVSAGTAELARSLLFSRDVSLQVSPALAAALALRSADSCEAVQAALPKALSDGDRRSLGPLAKLNSRRACGPKNTGDCNPCVRGPMKPIVAAVTAVKARRAPSFPAR